MKEKLLLIARHFRAFRQLLADNKGVTALEYGLIAAVMVTAIASTIRGVSQPVYNSFCNVYTSIIVGATCP